MIFSLNAAVWFIHGMDRPLGGVRGGPVTKRGDASMCVQTFLSGSAGAGLSPALLPFKGGRRFSGVSPGGGSSAPPDG